MKKLFTSLIPAILSLYILCSCSNVGNLESSSESSASEASDVSAENSISQKLLLYKETRNWGSSFGTETEIFSYDSSGVVIGSTIENVNGEICTREFTYDKAGRMIADITYNGADEVYSESKWVYDEDGNLIEYTDGYFGQTTKYVYDEQGRVSSYTVDDNDVYVYTYDEEGNYSVRQEGYDGVEYYNKDGELLESRYGDGSLQSSCVYDERGNKISQTQYGTDGEVTFMNYYEYNDNDLLVKEIHYQEDRIANTYIFEYDEFGNMLRRIVIDPLGVETVAREWEYKYFPIDPEK